MADDINKKINIDVELNSDGLQQITQCTTAITNLKEAVTGLAKPLADTSATLNSVGDAATQAAAKTTQAQKADSDKQKELTVKTEGAKSKTILDKVKDTLTKTFSLFVKTDGDKSKSATDTATKTNTDIANAATALQQLIGAKNLQITQDVADASYKIITEGIALETDAKVKQLETEKKQKLSAAGLTQDAINKINADYTNKEKNVKLQGFKAQQKADMGQAIINGAVAITKVTAQSGILAPLMLAGVIANTATQVAKIAAQKPPQFAKGGYFVSDGKGAVLPGYSRTDNTNAYLRSGEGVVVSEAMRDPWARNLVSAINVAFGGRDFSVPNMHRGYAVGGIFTDGGNANRYYNQPVNDQKNLANTVAYQMINNFPPVYVDVKDINNQQNILAQTINRVNL